MLDEEQEVTENFPSLKEFLVLNREEEQIRHDLRACNDEGVYHRIKQHPLFTIIKLAENDPSITALCQSPSLDDYWQNCWTQIEDEASGYRMQAQSLISAFDLVRGYHFYLLAIDAYAAGYDAQDPLIIDYLLKAQEYYSFHASYQLNGYWISALKETVTYEPQLDFSNLLALLQSIAAVHLTPGYILLATTCFELAHYYEHFAELADKKILCKQYYSSALEYLWAAEKLEPYSQASIANAYDGRSINEFYGAESRTWLDFRETILERSEALFTMADIKLIQKNAEIIVQNCIAQLLPPQHKSKTVEERFSLELH